jgi:predicted ATP-grasp superfamily ATP-dependent carboligase
MRLLVYEWSVAGGLGSAEVADAVGREGWLMVRAVLDDALRDGGFEIDLLVDATRPFAVPAGVRSIAVAPGADVDALVAASTAADVTLVVAPETDGLLADRVARCRAAGGRVLAPMAAFLAIAADKQATAEALAAAGVPVPAGRALAPNEPWPVGFIRPAVAKRRDGCGGEGYGVVAAAGAGGTPAPVDMPLRIEAFAPGDAVGVACLGGAAGVLPLPPLRQLFGDGPDGGRCYRGGEVLTDPLSAHRAERLAERAIDAVSRAAGVFACGGSPAAAGPTSGWVGVDMILGSRPDGGDDRVLEVNPRLTTSFVGLAAGSATSLMRLLVDGLDGTAAAAWPPSLSWGTSPGFRIPLDDRDASTVQRPDRPTTSGRAAGARYRRGEPQGG